MCSLKSCLSDLPPCSTTGAYEKGVFVTTNESNQQETLEKLSKCTVPGNTAVGVSGFFILNAATALGSQCTSSTEHIQNVVVVDCSQCAQFFWHNMRLILQMATNCREAFSMIQHNLSLLRTIYWPDNSDSSSEYYQKTLLTETQQGISFLSTEERFQLVHQIALHDNLEFKLLNLFEPEPIQQLVSALHTTARTVALVYVSNVSEFAFKSTRNPVFVSPFTELDHRKINGFLVSTSSLVGTRILLVHAHSLPRDVVEQIVYQRKQNDVVETEQTDKLSTLPHTIFSWKFLQ